MAVEIFEPVLTFAVASFVEILDDLCTAALRPFVVGVDIVNENGQTLRSATNLSRGAVPGFRTLEHDHRVAEMHLRAADWITVAVMLSETESPGQPCDRFHHVVINDMRQHDIGWDRAVFHSLANRTTEFYCNSTPFTVNESRQNFLEAAQDYARLRPANEKRPCEF